MILTMPRLFLILMLSFSSAFLSGCATTEQVNWLDDKVHAGSDRVLWEVTRMALDKNGFPIGAGLDEAHLVATSGWHISLAPFRGKGFREQCEIKYTRSAPGEYAVKLRVKREKNDDLVHPLDLTYAEWVAEPDNQERAQIVLQYIKSLLGGEYRARDKPKDATIKPKEATN